MCGGSKRYSNPRRARQSLEVARRLYGSQYAKTVAQRHGVNSRGMKTNGRSSTTNKAKTTNKRTSTKSTKTTNRSTSTKSSKTNKTKSKKVAGYNKNHPVAKMTKRVKNAPKRTTTPKLRKSQKVKGKYKSSVPLYDNQKQSLKTYDRKRASSANRSKRTTQTFHDAGRSLYNSRSQRNFSNHNEAYNYYKKQINKNKKYRYLKQSTKETLANEAASYHRLF